MCVVNLGHSRVVCFRAGQGEGGSKLVGGEQDPGLANLYLSPCSRTFSVPLLLPLLLPLLAATTLQARWSTLSGAQLSSAVVSLHRLGFSAWPEGLGQVLAESVGPQLSGMEAQALLWAAQVGLVCLCVWGGGGLGGRGEARGRRGSDMCLLGCCLRPRVDVGRLCWLLSDRSEAAWIRDAAAGV